MGECSKVYCTDRMWWMGVTSSGGTVQKSTSNRCEENGSGKVGFNGVVDATVHGEDITRCAASLEG